MIVGQRYRIIGQKYRLLSQDTEPLVKNTEYILKDTEPLVKNTEYLVKKYGVFDRGKSWTAPQRPVGSRLPHQATVTQASFFAGSSERSNSFSAANAFLGISSDNIVLIKACLGQGGVGGVGGNYSKYGRPGATVG